MSVSGNPPTYSRSNVLTAVSKLFPDKDSKIVLHELDSYMGDNETGTARIQLAILKLANGNINRIKHYIEAAKADFRDVILWAEYDDSDFPKEIPNPYEKLIKP